MSDGIDETSDGKNTESESPEKTERDRTLLFLDGFIEKCKQEQVKQAIVFLVDPKTQEPIIYQIGSEYAVARSIAWLFRNAKAKVIQELDDEAKHLY